MNPKAQQIAIAEARGYIGPFDTSEEWHDEGEGAFQAVILRDSRCCQVPDYLSDLNAMHQAEKMLTKEQRVAYANRLNQMTRGEHDNLYQHNNHVFATAAQRAEAFLKTINKWEGQP